MFGAVVFSMIFAAKVRSLLIIIVKHNEVHSQNVFDRDKHVSLLFQGTNYKVVLQKLKL